MEFDLPSSAAVNHKAINDSAPDSKCGHLQVHSKQKDLSNWTRLWSGPKEKGQWSLRQDKEYYNQSQKGKHRSTWSSSDVSNLAKYLARRDPLTAGLAKFNDKIENYWSWKSTFSNEIKDLNLKLSEEL